MGPHGNPRCGVSSSLRRVCHDPAGRTGTTEYSYQNLRSEFKRYLNAPMHWPGEQTTPCVFVIHEEMAAGGGEQWWSGKRSHPCHAAIGTVSPAKGPRTGLSPHRVGRAARCCVENGGADMKGREEGAIPAAPPSGNLLRHSCRECRIPLSPGRLQAGALLIQRDDGGKEGTGRALPWPHRHPGASVISSAASRRSLCRHPSFPQRGFVLSGKMTAGRKGRVVAFPGRAAIPVCECVHAGGG